MDSRAERGAKDSAPAQEAPAADPAATPKPSAAPAVATKATPKPTTAPKADTAPQAEAQPAAGELATIHQDSPGAYYGNQTKSDPSALSRESTRADVRAHEKSDGSDLTAPQRAAAPTAPRPAAENINGLVGVDVVVSQVDCTGAEVVEAAHVPHDLPSTGANGHAMRNTGAAGLALLGLGATVVTIARRRRQGLHRG
jgi:hypothetical protein